jgi:glyoxylase-like metal-dependent hydrolase (beta-lactamase superfamily II)
MGYLKFMLLPFKLTKNITLLGSEFFNLYLIKGETYAIMEGGVSGITYPVLKQISQLDVPPEAISHLIILHSHFDHMMVFPTLKEKYPWVKILSSEKNRAIFSSERILAKIFDSDRRMTLALMETGLVSEAPNLNPSISFPLDIALSEGSIFDLGNGIRIKFIETPGHSPDCLSAYYEEEGVLFCSDGSGFYTPPDFFRPNYWFRLDQAEKSIERMKAIDPEILCRGHYGAIFRREATRKHLQMARQSIEDFKTFLLERIQGGISVDAITEEVTERFSKGFLELFPPEENRRLWRLLIQRTLEHFSIEIETG